MIDINKQYRTRDGRDVRVLCVDRKHNNDYCVIALVPDFVGGEDMETFKIDGKWSDHTVDMVLDLIEVKSRIQRDVWVNVYPEELPEAIHSCKGFADIDAAPDRIACVKLTIDCEEGEGL